MAKSGRCFPVQAGWPMTVQSDVCHSLFRILRRRLRIRITTHRNLWIQPSKENQYSLVDLTTGPFIPFSSRLVCCPVLHSAVRFLALPGFLHTRPALTVLSDPTLSGTDSREDELQWGTDLETLQWSYMGNIAVGDPMSGNRMSTCMETSVSWHVQQGQLVRVGGAQPVLYLPL